MTPPTEGTTHTLSTVERLDEATCWEVLKQMEFGRLAYVVDGHLDLVPVNYAVHNGEIVFRTAEGSKLAGVTHGQEVVFEIDDIAAETATSVIVRAMPREYTHDEARWADQMRLRPWVSDKKEYVIGLAPTLISGRRFHLSRPWRSMRTHS